MRVITLGPKESAAIEAALWWVFENLQESAEFVSGGKYGPFRVLFLLDRPAGRAEEGLCRIFLFDTRFDGEQPAILQREITCFGCRFLFSHRPDTIDSVLLSRGYLYGSFPLPIPTGFKLDDLINILSLRIRQWIIAASEERIETILTPEDEGRGKSLILVPSSMADENHRANHGLAVLRGNGVCC